TTLAPIFSDPDLTVPLVNPQVLLSKTDSLGARYGKFAKPVYVGQPYYLDINTTEQSGIRGVPLTSIDGVNASLGTATATGSTRARTLADRASDTIHALDYGAIGNSPTTNTATLTTAIGAAAARGGGYVRLPAGVIVFNQITIPQHVVLAGYGRAATILQSQVAGRAIELTGADSGLADLTLDGISLIDGSVGLYGRAINRVRLDNVEIKRFDKGVFFRGGRDHVYRSLDIVNNGSGISLRGDDDFVGTGVGDEFSGLDWFQGAVREHLGGGLDLTMFDMPVKHNVFHQVDFIDNLTEPAVLVTGASFSSFRHCYWEGNTVNMTVEDNADTTLLDRRVVGLSIDGGQMVNGTLTLDGLCQDVVLERMELNGLEIQANVPDTQVLVRDCTEIDTLISGDTTKVVRFRTVNAGSVTGQTTNATPLVAWKTRLQPNEVVIVDCIATAEAINTTDHAAYAIIAAARQPPATLTFDERTAAFSVGKLLIGGTSGATGIITAATNATTGTISLASVEGTFLDNELLTEEGGTGGARVNGAMIHGVNTLVGTPLTTFTAESPDTLTWGLSFAVAQQELQLIVTGEAAKTIIWTINVRMTVA
ncbi:MAG: Pectate lyase superfamily protein, partial [Rhizobiaceae bacterium]|nr:Pectate lyase superfamily protein [Rhizobiaceae bacterium]